MPASSLGAIQNRMEGMAASASFEFLLCTGPTIFASSADDAVTPKVFEIEATYSFDNKNVTEKTVIDLRPYLGTAVPHSVIKDGFEVVAKSVDDLKRELKNR